MQQSSYCHLLSAPLQKKTKLSTCEVLFKLMEFSLTDETGKLKKKKKIYIYIYIHTHTHIYMLQYVTYTFMIFWAYCGNIWQFSTKIQKGFTQEKRDKRSGILFTFHFKIFLYAFLSYPSVWIATRKEYNVDFCDIHILSIQNT